MSDKTDDDAKKMYYTALEVRYFIPIVHTGPREVISQIHTVSLWLNKLFKTPHNQDKQKNQLNVNFKSA